MRVAQGVIVNLRGKCCRIDLMMAYCIISILVANMDKGLEKLWLTLTMLRLLLSKSQERKDFKKPSKPCHLGIHWKALAEYSQMRFQSFLRIFVSFCFDQGSQQQHKG